MGRQLTIAILAITAVALLHSTAAQQTHLVGDKFGWLVPPGGAYAYEAWAETQTFAVGDILEFNFTTGEQDVARVTKEAFESCNISNTNATVETTGPVYFKLETVGQYFFIGTKDKRCELGQKLAINVTANPGPNPSPSVPAPAPTPRGPVTYTVGDKLGWIVPGSGYAYATWAYGKTFIVGDTLVFNFVNDTQDVAVVTKSAYENCTTNNTTAVYTKSPVSILLNTSGEHFFTSTYYRHCVLGQKLAINVTARSTATSPSGSVAPSSPTTSTGGPGSAPAPFSSAPSKIGSGHFTFVLISMAAFFFY
ncbi:hypothetical protein Pyn_06208 [Prunus yedoensis var. nudiflora]|uniref:Phytocyanin domain-containing protein n=1 Tax=Prunus yedoensis var. nudiflora TaxID=2094558 RepID=A0A314XWX6_PRUYE|nr:hypothetical protein Pyn_06208 [Prunus yedoensis var. nudiflora]